MIKYRRRTFAGSTKTSSVPKTDDDTLSGSKATHTDQSNDITTQNNITTADTMNETTTTKSTAELITEAQPQQSQQQRKDAPQVMGMNANNLPFGHICDDIAIDNVTPYVRLYCQNVNGIFDRDGIGLDSAFKEMKQAGADIFTFNETQGDESNAEARWALRLSKQRMWRVNNEPCKIIHSLSTAPVLTFTKPGGNLVGISGPLVRRV